jgi:hypothetical protein
MVAVVENRTAVVAVVGGQRDVDEVLVELVLDVAEAGPVEGYPDLVSGQLPADRTLVVRARRAELPGTDLVGSRLRGQVALAGPGVVRLVTSPPDAPELTPPG